MPIYFWNDPDGKKYHNAYFSVYPGIWRHGDYVLFNSKTRGIIFFGRSDSLLMPSGVRIGTSEIYNQVEELEEITDSLAIGQKWKEDQRIILFVKLAKGYDLTDDLKKKIKVTLRKNASPRHVPAIIMEAPDIPYTFSGKKVESAITNIINGKAVTNRDALANPESLDYYEKIVGELET
jgi:acetoacetyl-CoA synthetase